MGSPAKSLANLPLEVSFVLPCLNEARTIEICVRKALSFLERRGVRGEVIVADNGSTDGSRELAAAAGARVVPVSTRGYGAAIIGGIRAAQGRYVIMGDADDSYDFTAVGPFLDKLRDGHQLVMGNRFQGGIDPGAMPFLHKFLGNPVLTAIGRLFFSKAVGDFHCGLRAFDREAMAKVGLSCPGMEFASEMVARASLHGFRIAQVPTVLKNDGRGGRRPHLRTWRDGWRHLRFLLLFSPLWLFCIPGALLVATGTAVTAVLYGGPLTLGTVAFDIHTMLAASLLPLLGFQLLSFATFTKVYAAAEGLHPPSKLLARLTKSPAMEVGLAVGAAVALCGGGLLLHAFLSWKGTGYGGLDPKETMRDVIPAVMLAGLGAQIAFSSFFLGVLGLKQ